MDQLFEKIYNSLPKPLLALIVIAGGIAFFMLNDPPHTICDTQAEVLRESQKGRLFATQFMIKGTKQKLPPQISQAKEICKLNNSAGTCYEYFAALKDIATDIGKSSSECEAKLFEISEVKAALNDGIEILVMSAWGGRPPDLGGYRFNWLSESEIAVFCRIKNVYIRGLGEESWDALRKKIFAKFPGDAPRLSATNSAEAASTETPRAQESMSEQDIWSRSLYSVRCEAYQ